MSNCYMTTYFDFGPVTDDELTIIRNLVEKENADSGANSDGIGDEPIELSLERTDYPDQGTYIGIGSSESPNLSSMGRVYQEYLKMRNIPRGFFTFSCTTDKNLNNGFCGGVVLVSQDRIHIIDANAIGNGFIEGGKSDDDTSKVMNPCISVFYALLPDMPQDAQPRLAMMARND